MIPLSGTLDLSTVRTELGAAGAFDLGGANVRSLAGVPTGPLDLSTLRGGIWIGASENAANIFTKAGSPGSAVAVRAVVAAAAVVGSTAPGTPALAFGNFPAGSAVTVDNYGIVQGAGGLPNGGVGGHAIHAQTSAAFTKTINNKAGATVRAGGGAGGYGGTGGVGGQGGPGSGTTTTGPSYSASPQTRVVYDVNAGTSAWYWNGANVANTGGTPSGSVAGNDGATYTAGALQSSGPNFNFYYISQTVTGSGGTPGAGGAGGAGGNGGRGQGHDGVNAAGAGGSAGGAGGAGTGGAGNGGTGGAGGAGGTGGGWGLAGAGGGAGASGNAGAAGSGGAGAAGGGPSAPGAGGAAGSYLYAGGQAVTFNNAGTVAGNLS